MTYKRGSKGDTVRQIQKALANAGFAVTCDGIFGQATEKAVKAYQKQKGLPADGIVGAKTLPLLIPGTPSEGIDIANGYIHTHITRSINRPIKYIAVHYTAGGTSKKGAAMNTKSVFLNPKRRGSADFVVDDETIVQINPDLKNYYCWGVGDSKNHTSGGGRLYSIATNRNTISIEVCSNLKKGFSASYPNHAGWYYTTASLDNTRRLIRYLMKKYNVPKANVVRHYDISGKLCPGIHGWNDAYIYTDTGTKTGEKNNSKEWLEFWQSI